FFQNQPTWKEVEIPYESEPGIAPRNHHAREAASEFADRGACLSRGPRRIYELARRAIRLAAHLRDVQPVLSYDRHVRGRSRCVEAPFRSGEQHLQELRSQ